MTQLPESIRNIDDRLASLEASNRRLKRGLVAVVAVGLGDIGISAGQPGWGSGSGKDQPKEDIRDAIVDKADADVDEKVVDTIRVRRLLVVDDAGEPKIIMDTNDDGQASLVLAGPEKLVTLNASLDGDPASPGPVFVMNGTSGRVSLVCIDGIGPVMLMQDENTAMKVFIGSTDDGASGVIQLINPSTSEEIRLVPGEDDN